MAQNDWAIIIGISRYPSFGGNAGAGPRDLQGPENDADMIEDWLLRPDGGDVPQSQIIKVTSASFAAPAPQGPRLDDIVAKFNDLKVASDNARPLGRFYFYVSGHGYGRDRSRGGLYLADSTLDTPTDLFVSSYLSWFAARGMFRECVLFCDACMDQGRLSFPTPVHWDSEIRLGPHQTRTFGSYAARFAGQAVEGMMEDGKMHGVYSYALKLGLDGAAAVSDGAGGRHITARSLQDYLIAVMPKLMTDAQRGATLVSKEPDQGPLDNFTLVTNPPLFQRDVKLVVPGAAGAQPTLFDASLASIGNVDVVGGEGTAHLSPGFYLLSSADGGWEESFEYTGAEQEIDLR